MLNRIILRFWLVKFLLSHGLKSVEVGVCYLHILYFADFLLFAFFISHNLFQENVVAKA